MIKIFSALVLTVLCITSAFAGDAAVKQAVQARLPNAVIKSIAPTPYAGLYEVVTPRELFYTDAQADFFFVGSLIDAKTMRNLTQERMEAMRRVRFDRLPFALALKMVHGNGQRRLVVFSDPDCPYCKRLEAELEKINNLTVYTFLYPIPSLHPTAPAKARAIWCARNRIKAWETWMRRGVLPRGKARCATPLAKIARLAAKIRVSGTPTLVFPDGHVVTGFVPVARLEKMLNAATAAAAAAK
ncbi:MAG TPA: thiol:disulfide interchange protein [Betaproteobacteria bacterium]|nr:thiol:disulfide interchange protein [Betaproteobacteria bacterium]